MSWDIVIFSTKQKVSSLEEIDESLFVPINFCTILEKHFDNIIINEDHRSIEEDDFSFNYFIDEEPVSNKMFSLYGEKALYELVRLAKLYSWQIFDTGNGKMIDLNFPEENGYEDFQTYLQYVLNKYCN